MLLWLAGVFSVLPEQSWRGGFDRCGCDTDKNTRRAGDSGVLGAGPGHFLVALPGGLHVGGDLGDRRQQVVPFSDPLEGVGEGTAGPVPKKAPGPQHAVDGAGHRAGQVGFKPGQGSHVTPTNPHLMVDLAFAVALPKWP